MIERWVAAAALAGVATGCAPSGGGGGRGTDTARGAFTQVGSLATGRVGHTATVIPSSDQVLVVGGKGRSGTTDAVLDSAEIFDPKTGTFTPATGTLAGAGQAGSNGRMSHAAVAAGSAKVVVIGGQTDVAGQSPLDTCEVFDPTTTTFGAVQKSLAEPKAEAVAIAYEAGGVPYVVIAGGRKSSDPQTPGAAQVSLTSVDRYRGDTELIEPAIPGVRLLTGRYGARTALLGSGEYVVQGGVERPAANSVPSPAGFEIFAFDPATGDYDFTQSNQGLPGNLDKALRTDRFDGDLALLGTAPAAFGGSDDPTAATAPLDTIEFYDDATNSWTAVTARLKTPRQGHTVTRLANGDVLVVGGEGANYPALATSEIASGSGVNATVVPGPPLKTPRRRHTATLLSSGQILIVGGEDASGTPLATVEVFALPGSTVNGVGLGIVTPGGPGAPTGLTIVPASGPVGAQVTVHSANGDFAPVASRNIVRFNGVVAPVQVGTTSDLVVKVPNGATTGDVTVQIGTSVSTPNPTFTVSTSSAGGTGGG